MSKKRLLLLTLVFLIVYISVGFASDLDYNPGELIVRFAPKTNSQHRTLAECNTILTEINGGTVKRSCKLVPGLTLVKLPENLSVEDALIRFKNVKEILYAEANYKISIESTEPNDPYYQSGNLWGLKKIDANDAWDIHTGSGEIIVAVIDTGIDYNHNDLKDNMWVNEVELNGTPGVDDDGNGYIDDIYGYDFCTYGGKQRDSDPNDDAGHGTQCAGIIGAVGNNNEGVVGVCWNVKIMALKFVNSSGYGWSYDAIDSISYAVQMGANVLNNSYGYYKNDPRLADINALRDAIEAADANGVLFVASAGNDNKDNDVYDHYPSNYDLDNVIAVMATDSVDRRWMHDSNSASNYGATTVDLAAPGSNIYTCGLGGGYISQNGTSMAAPYVAGACALVWSVNPSLSHLDVKRVILETVDLIPELQNQTPCLSGGRLNVYNAVIEAGQLALTKIDDVNYGDLVLPDANIIYTINYGNPVTAKSNPIYIGTVNDVNIIDHLPDEIDFISASGPNMVYDSNSRTVSWQIGALSAGETDSVTLTVKVNELAEPLGSITNVCVIDGTGIRPTTATEIADVNYWTPDVIYVDINATGSKTGMTWGNAYTNLQDALERAADCYVPQIWVAKGRYKPTTNPANHSATFALINGVALYGGFSGDGTETNINQRNWNTNETILTGDVDNDGIADDITTVVTATNVTETAIIDGFTITKARSYGGIRCSNASPTIRNNKTKDNIDSGVRCESGSSPDIINCEISNNGRYGIYCSSSSPVIANNIIKDHLYTGGGAGYGIYASYSAPVIKNNWICNNSGSTGYGIWLSSPSFSAAVIRNNTIADNKTNGIKFSSGAAPNITNCILWGNGYYELYNCSATYSCIQDCNYTVNPNLHNICSDPCFVDANAGDYHLDPNVSPCIDAGDPNFIPEPNETDIDGNPRLWDGNQDGISIVDMGADETDCFPRYHSDYNKWVSVGKPTCWCYPRQCRGDSDNTLGGDPKTGYYYVGGADLQLLLNNWQIKEPPKGPGISGEPNICADFDHNLGGDPKTGYYRVGGADLQILLDNWQKREPPKGSGTPADCLNCTQGQRAGASPESKEYSIKELLQWLDKIWADEQVQEQLSEQDLQKLIDSLKEQSQN